MVSYVRSLYLVVAPNCNITTGVALGPKAASTILSLKITSKGKQDGEKILSRLPTGVAKIARRMPNPLNENHMGKKFPIATATPTQSKIMPIRHWCDEQRFTKFRYRKLLII